MRGVVLLLVVALDLGVWLTQAVCQCSAPASHPFDEQPRAQQIAGKFEPFSLTACNPRLAPCVSMLRVRPLHITTRHTWLRQQANISHARFEGRSHVYNRVLSAPVAEDAIVIAIASGDGNDGIFEVGIGQVGSNEHASDLTMTQ